MQFNINGRRHDLAIDPRTSLLDLLRERLRLTGTKKGCDQGACGACTVLVEGVRINSCLALAVQYHGREITTVEGLSSEAELHPLQRAFIEHDGFNADIARLDKYVLRSQWWPKRSGECPVLTEKFHAHESIDG